MRGAIAAVCWPCCTERWSWRCTPGRRRRTAWTLPQFAGCFLPGLRRWSPGSCSAHGERCLRPGSNTGSRGTQGTPPGQSWWWSSRRQTSLEDRWEPVRLLNNNKSSSTSVAIFPHPTEKLPVSQMVQPLKPPRVPTTCPLLLRLTWWAWNTTLVDLLRSWNKRAQFKVHWTRKNHLNNIFRPQNMSVAW